MAAAVTLGQIESIQKSQQNSLTLFWGKIGIATSVAAIAATHFLPGGMNLASTLGILNGTFGVFSIRSAIREWRTCAKAPDRNAANDSFKKAFAHTCVVAFQCFSLLYVVFKESAQANLLSRFAFGFSIGLGISGVKNLIQHFGSKQRQYNNLSLMKFDPDFQNFLGNSINEETILTQANAFIDQNAREEIIDSSHIETNNFGEIDGLLVKNLAKFCKKKKEIV